MRTSPIESNKRKAPIDQIDHREQKRLRLTDDPIPEEITKIFGQDNLQQLTNCMMNHLQKNHDKSKEKGSDYFSLQDMVWDQLPGWPDIVLLQDVYLKLSVYLTRKNLCDFLARHPEISRLDFSEFQGANDFFTRDIAVETLVLLLSACPHIKELNLSNRNIFYVGSPVFQKLISIPSLILNSVKGAKDIPAGLEAVSMSTNRLVSLGMCDTSINDENVENIVNIQSLEELDLSHNAIGDVGAAKIAGMKKLRRLILRGCFIGRLGLKALLSNHNITYLDLSMNRVDNDALYALANEITRNKHIAREIWLYNNWHHGALEPLEEAMKKNSVVILQGIKHKKINLMSDRNILLKKYPEYASYIKRIFHEHGLYEYQLDEQKEPSNLASMNIHTELRQRESGRAVNVQALDEIKNITLQLESLHENMQTEEERHYEEHNRWFG